MLQQHHLGELMMAIGHDVPGGALSYVAQALAKHRRLQRQSLERLLSLPESTYAKDPLLDEPNVFTIQFMPTDGIQPSDIAAFSLVSRSWSVAWRAWLVSAAARPFWQRLCASMELDVPILHPELCTKETLLDWVRLPMAAGTREQWNACGLGLAVHEDDEDAMTELELGSSLALFFALWLNIEVEDGPCQFPWFGLGVHPFLDGTTHEQEANPGEHSLITGAIPKSMLASLLETLQDFRICPNFERPDFMSDEAAKTIRALMARFSIPHPSEAQMPEGVMPRFKFIPMSAEQNTDFFGMLKRYAPLFPQRSDQEPRVEVEPVFAAGERRCNYPMPRPLMRPMMPTKYNQLLVFDAGNTDRDQEAWTFHFGTTMRGIEEDDNAPSDDSEGDDMMTLM